MINRTLWLLLLVVLAIPVALFLYLYEPVRDSVDIGWTTQAYRNPLLAAETFLSGRAHAVRSADRLAPEEQLPSTVSVYAMGARQVLTSSQSDVMIGWIESGGHLILSIEDSDEESPLLDYFSVSVYSGDDHHGECDHGNDDLLSDADPSAISSSDESSVVASSEADSGKTESIADSLRRYNQEMRDLRSQAEDITDDEAPQTPMEDLTALTFEGVADALTAELGTSILLDHPVYYSAIEVGSELDDLSDSPPEAFEHWRYEPSYATGNHLGVQFMQFEVEEGLLTLIAGQSPFSNSTIQEHDHAYLLAVLTQTGSETLLLYGAYSPGLASVIWGRWPELVISSILLLFGYLWFYGVRFGATVDAQSTSRRGIEEHLHSSGQYLWNTGNADTLLQPLQRDVLSKARRVFAGLDKHDGDTQAALIGARCNLPATTVAHALNTDSTRDTPLSQDAFTERVRTLVTLKELL